MTYMNSDLSGFVRVEPDKFNLITEPVQDEGT